MNNPLYWSTWSRASTTNPDSLTVWHNDMLFDFKTGVRQRCMMSEVLFNLAIDLVNRKKDNKRFSMRDLRAFSHLANNLALLSHSHLHIQQSKTRPADRNLYWQQVGLQISTKKTETIVNMDMPAPIKANLEKLRQADYLPGQHHQTRRCTKEDIHSRLGKARSEQHLELCASTAPTPSWSCTKQCCINSPIWKWMLENDGDQSHQFLILHTPNASFRIRNPVIFAII